MKRAQLILLENPVIVTDEDIKVGNNFYYKHFGEDIVSIADSTTDLKNANTPDRFFKKIISTNKQIDYNGIDFGVVDVEKLAFNYCGSSQAHRRGFIDGFNASQKLNEKKFSVADMIECFNAARRYRMKNVFEFECGEEYLDNMQPKTFDIEIEETETHIKILRKLC